MNLDRTLQTVSSIKFLCKINFIIIRYLRNCQCLIAAVLASSSFSFTNIVHVGLKKTLRTERYHERSTPCSARTYTRSRIYTRIHVHGGIAHDVSLVDLQDKYYSEKLDYRYRPRPNVDESVRRRARRISSRPTNTHVTCVCACVWKTFAAISSRSSSFNIQSTFPTLFSFARGTDRDIARSISVSRNDVTFWWLWIPGVVGASANSNILTHDNIAHSMSFWKCRATFFISNTYRSKNEIRERWYVVLLSKMLLKLYNSLSCGLIKKIKLI